MPGRQIVRFVIPNRDDPDKNPTIYRDLWVNHVPRIGEYVELYENDDAAESGDGTTWVVKHVSHVIIDVGPAVVKVRLLEPDHWSLQG